MKTIAQALDGMPCSDDAYLPERLESWMRDIQREAFEEGFGYGRTANGYDIKTCFEHAQWTGIKFKLVPKSEKQDEFKKGLTRAAEICYDLRANKNPKADGYDCAIAIHEEISKLK